MDGKRLIKEREISGGEPDTTNNRMELLAAIKALEALSRPSRISILTDSAYVKNGITAWIRLWKTNGWRTSTKDPVKNADLWKQLDALQVQHKVTWQWVKGHSVSKGNQRADKLARKGMAAFRKKRRRDTQT